LQLSFCCSWNWVQRGRHVAVIALGSDRLKRSGLKTESIIETQDRPGDGRLKDLPTTLTWLSSNDTLTLVAEARILGFGNSISLMVRVSDLARGPNWSRPPEPGRLIHSSTVHTQGLKLSYRTYENIVQKQM
jgi:hypothetical protein